MENANTNTPDAPQTVKAHFAGHCHKCEVAKIAERMSRGESVDDATANAARDACAKCKGAAENSNRGICFVTLDGMPTPGDFLAAYIDREYSAMLKTPRADTVSALDETAEKIALELIEAFRGLTIRQLQVLHGLLNGKDLTAMAKEYGISKQAFSKHMEKIPQTRAVAAFVRALIHSRDGHDALKKSRMLARD